MEFDLQAWQLWLPERGPRIHFWIQGISALAPKLTYNMAYAKRCADDELNYGGNGLWSPRTVDWVGDSGIRTFTVDFSDNVGDWVSMGSNTNRTGRLDPDDSPDTSWYAGVQSMAEVWGGTLADCGLLAIWPNTQRVASPVPHPEPTNFVVGALRIHAVRMYSFTP
jgi:hypothetical protein